MKKILLALAIVSVGFSGFTTLCAQTDPVVIRMKGKDVRQSELMHDFLQAGGDRKDGRPIVGDAARRQSLLEYAELYANFHAKLLDARAMGMDTAASLIEELGRYRKELAAPYLIDSAMLRAILDEAYERNHYALHAAHVLVRVNSDASPADTLAAYNRALELRQRIVDGEEIVKVAAEEVLRLNPRAQVRPNEGELNYFSVFDMVYPFENGAYGLQPGEVSMPVRSRYGYHIIKLLDKVEMYGKVTLQHYWKRNTHEDAIVTDAYNQLLAGTPFEMVARQSDDLSTAEKGGYISDATLAQLPHEYVKVLSTLKEGEFSKPFLSRYGWHIVKLVKKETLPPFENMVPFYKQRMTRDQRGDASRRSFAQSCRKRYGVKDLTVTPVLAKGKKKGQPQMMASLEEIEKRVDKSLFAGDWSVRDSAFKQIDTLLVLPDRSYNTLDVVHFIRRNQKAELPKTPQEYVRQRYERFIDSVTLIYADSQLEKENPEFAALVEEYRRGLLIFNYNDQMIWTKAIKDSTGFAGFYDRESKKKRIDLPEDSLFFWHTRARIINILVKDSLCLDPQKAVKTVSKAVKKDKGSAEMFKMLCDKVNSRSCKPEEALSYSLEVVERGRQHLLQPGMWTPGVYTLPEGKGYRVVVVQEVMEPCLKGMTEARGYYLNAWQNEVEQELCNQLRSKYNVTIDSNAIGQIRY